jgi:hypothetical protein
MLKKVLVATLFAAVASTALVLPAKADSLDCTTQVINGALITTCVVVVPGGGKHQPLQQ